jgi:glycosyltransferase involved in cell wall biosynthesis
MSPAKRYRKPPAARRKCLILSDLDLWSNRANSSIEHPLKSPPRVNAFYAQRGTALKLSIITAVYNREHTVAQAISSVAAQSCSDVEHLIVDGASTDGTLAAVQRLARTEMKVISEPDRGIYDALNKGIRAATGEVVGLMHSDDFFAHERVLEKVAFAFATTGADAVYGDLDYVAAADTSKIIRHWRSGEFVPQRLARGWMPPHPTLFVRRDAMLRLGLYDTDYRIAADYEAILRWFGKGELSLTYIPEVLVKMRVGGESNRSLGRIIRKSREDYRALRSTGVGGLRALAWKNLSKLPQFLTK